MPNPNASPRRLIVDGNEACASVAYRLNEACAIYPITPSSPMGELADQWSARQRENIWGNIPHVIEMQSEGGAAGALHGALQTGALTTTFTASQGLLLMIPNMYKIAGELTAAVIHVAARSLACQGLSIFGDHSDVMAVRQTGFAMLASASVQEAHDMAVIAQMASLSSRIPFVHFFDGFRTSHELNQLEPLDDEDLRALIDDELVFAHRRRGLNPDHPSMRGTAQNPDVYFQARESVNAFYAATPAIVSSAMQRFAERCGRHYRNFDYHGDEQAERVIVIMGSGAETAAETAIALNRDNARVGVIQVRLYRPFSIADFLAVLPPSTRSIAVLDRTKEPGSVGEPLYLDVVAAIAEAAADNRLRTRERPGIIGGRYGLSSKEFTPAMVKAVFDELGKASPRNHFSVGIHDDVTGNSLDYEPGFLIDSTEIKQAVFYGLGADGTVGANKNSIKILGEDENRYAQAYFVYDSKKSGSQTVSHLRFGPQPIRAAYLVQSAQFIGCHQFAFVQRQDVLRLAAPGACFLLNSPYAADTVWQHLPEPVRRRILDLDLSLHVIDAYAVARDHGLGNRINTIMQTCFFALSGVLARDRAIERIKQTIEKSYANKGPDAVAQNFAAVDAALDNLHAVRIPAEIGEGPQFQPTVAAEAPEFVRNVTAMMLAGRGDELPVSLLPVDGTYPTATSRWEKRNVSPFVPKWEPELCVQCGNCSLVCPHGVIRAGLLSGDQLLQAPQDFAHARIDARGFPDTYYTLQIYVEDCTGCALCVEVCPARDKQRTALRAINMTEKAPLLEANRENLRFFESIPTVRRGQVDFSTVRGVQFLPPLFEFSGACAGCGETPYVKLLSQLFGDRLLVANATGCSSIYGGNLPTTPWSQNAQGRGPAWSNSLFEDAAEFGLGFRLTADQHLQSARRIARELAPELGIDWVDALCEAPQSRESEILAQRARVDSLRDRLSHIDSPAARHLESLADQFVRRSIWIVGGDGWAYDIGSAGLDHVLASGRDINVLVLDTEVYSNTGGQMSKSTPLAAVAKFASGGKTVPKKDLALQAMAYGNVYVARVALGANPQQTLLALRQAEAYPGPSLILAYSHCIAHGINMQHGLKQQDLAVDCGHWPLLRYNPELRDSPQNPFMLDSAKPRIPLSDYARNEMRYRILETANPRAAAELMSQAQTQIDRKWALYRVTAEHWAGADPQDSSASDSP